MLERIKAKISLRVEVIEGEDKGYTFEESNEVVDLGRLTNPGHIVPYELRLRFLTPSCMHPPKPKEEAYWIDESDYCPSAHGIEDEIIPEVRWRFRCSKCDRRVFDEDARIEYLYCPYCGSEMTSKEGGT